MAIWNASFCNIPKRRKKYFTQKGRKEREEEKEEGGWMGEWKLSLANEKSSQRVWKWKLRKVKKNINKNKNKSFFEDLTFKLNFFFFYKGILFPQKV